MKLPGGPDTKPGPRVGRWVWWVLGSVALAGAVVVMSGDHARSWHYFADAARLLAADPSVEGSRFDLYRAHPEFQFGPLAVLVAAPFTLLPPAVEVAAVVVVSTLAGVVVLAAVADLVRSLHPELAGSELAWPLLLGGGAFLVGWVRLAAYTTHVDDVAVLVAVALALAAVGRQRPGWAAVALAAAAAVKPWAIVFLPLGLAGGGRWPLPRVVGAAVAAALTWLPFVLLAPGTVGALRSFSIDVDPNAALRLVGVDGAPIPGWVRPTQMALGLGLTSLVVVRRGAWVAVVALGVAVRLLLDPATNHYYTTGFLLGALAWELSWVPTRLPWRAVVAAAVLDLTATDLTLGSTASVLRVALLAAVIVAALSRGPAPGWPALRPPSVLRCGRARPG